MRVIFDIGHPAHVHLFKHLARLLLKNGDEVLFTARDKEFELTLLKAEGFPYVNFGKHYRSLPGKLWGLLRYDLVMFRTGLRFKPDLFISHGTPYAAHAAFLLGAKNLAIEDTGNIEQVMLYRPFTDAILTPTIMPNDLGAKQIRYNSHHEIAYLHPDFFRPNPSIRSLLGVREDEPYAVIRFISWNASHDVGHKGMTADDKVRLVQKLAERMRVFITSERGVADELKPFCLSLPPDKFHDVMYYASIVVSEGTTTAIESGVLGTPCIYISTLVSPTCVDMEQFGLVFNTPESDKVFDMVDKILDENRDVFRERSKVYLALKENATQFYFNFIINRYQKNGKPRLASSPKPLQPETRQPETF